MSNRCSKPFCRYIVFGLFLFCIQVPSLFAQQPEKFNIQFNSRSLKSILDEVSALTGYEFAYSDTEVNSDRLITIKTKQKNAKELIMLIAGIAELDAHFTGNKVLLKSLKTKQFYLITGTVRDAINLTPLAEAHIAIPSSPLGTITDKNGYFILEIPSIKNSIRVTSTGYSPYEIKIIKDTTLNIKLCPIIQSLAETVIVAFGEEPKDLISGAVSYFKFDAIGQPAVPSLNGALQYELPGLLVTPNGGTPGSGMNVTIRGTSSITAGNKPLFVVDGIPIIAGDYSQLDFSGQTIDAISDLSISDIESVSILKDAAASSLFGSNSSNGVILIKTKRGVANQNSIEFHSSYGYQQTTGRLEMLNARQWMNMINEQATFEGKPLVYSMYDIQNNTVDTDWQHEVFRSAPVSDIGLSIRGGTVKSRYYISGNYFNQDGIIIGTNFKRYNLRMNYNYQINDKLEIETGNSFAYSVNNRVEGDQSLNGPLPNAIAMPAIYPVYNSDGSYNNDGPYANPVSIAMLEKNLAFTYRNTFHFKATYRLNKNFSVKSLSGLDFYDLHEQTFSPKTTRQGAKYNGLGIEATSNALRFYHTTYLDYVYLKDLSQLSVTAGYSVESNKQHDTFLRAQNFAGTSFEFLQDAATSIATQSFETDAAAGSLFSRIKYSFNNRYILTLNLRRDGSSKFGSNNRFGFFPSLSGLWYISKEDFFKCHSFTKLIFSASYGITGNDQIEGFLALDLFSAGNNYGGEGGISPSQLANPNLKWESTNQFNLGAQFELFGKISVKADYYYKKTRDLLLQKPLPSSTGYAYIVENIGKLENQGFETEISVPIFEGPFQWHASFNFTTNRNKVLELYDGQAIRNIGRAGSSIEVGEPVSFFYGFNVLGVNPENGDLIYEDLNNDGRVTDLDRKKTGSPHPDFYGGLGSSIAYKNFSLNFMFSFVYGNNIFNSTRIYIETISLANQSTDILRRWQQPGDITDVPKASVYNQRISSRFVEDGSFIRLKNIKLSYALPVAVISRIGLSNLQFFVACKNLLTLTRYSGMDPEVNYNGINSIVLGTDFFTCPQSKSISLGLCARF